jgi:hypothetical protein
MNHSLADRMHCIPLGLSADGNGSENSKSGGFGEHDGCGKVYNDRSMMERNAAKKRECVSDDLTKGLQFGARRSRFIYVQE